MSLTFIDTNSIPREHTAHGDFKEILNEKLAGAKNVVSSLHWLNEGEKLGAGDAKHNLFYFIEGSAKVTLAGKDYDVPKGGGIYLQPSETASIAGAADGLKMLQLAVPVIAPN
ncbi:MAG: hypothetical protein WCP82_02225 [Alphaproteobacteria bacterium]|jgi:hypothetical protein